MNPQRMHSPASLLLRTNPFLTKPAINCRKRSRCQCSGECKHSNKHLCHLVVDGDCMENSLCPLQRWALETRSLQSQCMKNMMRVVGRGRLGRELELCTLACFDGSNRTGHSATRSCLFKTFLISSTHSCWFIFVRTQRTDDYSNYPSTFIN